MFIIGEIIGKWAPFAASIVGFLLYVLIGKILDVRGFTAVRKLATAWFYYLIMVASLGYVFSNIPSFLGQGFPWDNTVDTLTPSTEQPQNTGETSTGDYVYEATGMVISGDIQEIPHADTGTISTGSIITTWAQEKTGVLSEEDTLPQPISPETNTITSGSKKDVTMLEAIKYVLKENKIPLSKKTDVSFQNLSKSSSDYAYAKTAQEKAMIGKNANVAQQISCDTYMVFKWIAEGRKIGTYSDVKGAYRDKAKELWKLNGCMKGKWLTSDKL